MEDEVDSIVAGRSLVYSVRYLIIPTLFVKTGWKVSYPYTKLKLVTKLFSACGISCSCQD